MSKKEEKSMTESKWVWLNTTSGRTRLDLTSIIAVTKAGKNKEENFVDVHMVSGTIFTILYEDWPKLREDMGE